MNRASRILPDRIKPWLWVRALSLNQISVLWFCPLQTSPRHVAPFIWLVHQHLSDRKLVLARWAETTEYIQETNPAGVKNGG